MNSNAHDTVFLELRPRLFGIAYRMLGSIADAEDVLQDHWLRWRARDPDLIDNNTAYLTRVVTNLSIDTLRRLKLVRDEYSGPWLPPPVIEEFDDDTSGEVMTDLTKSLSVALMALLETLSPNERATFVLREAFELSFDEIADCLSSKPATCRQWSTRARRRMSGLKWRDSSPGLERGILERFVGAMSTSNHTALLELLDSDVELISDGGGKVSAARRPLYGSREVSRFLIGLGKRHAGRLGGRMVKANNDWGGIVTINDEIDSVFSIRISDGRISGVYIVRNPDKLALVAKPTSV
ncbi:MAG: RNA polymerase sigma-70 factor (ECF subfamily) [Gammaproteobacteria bacterium]|jgi:RNA polymerase sigma-70 factor (ECF subfamily)